jgi:hypothetical protein
MSARARIHLYKYLDTLQQTALYCDRLIFIQTDDQLALIETGDSWIDDVRIKTGPSH